jgi:hypothetical protein
VGTEDIGQIYLPILLGIFTEVSQNFWRKDYFTVDCWAQLLEDQ